MAFQPRKNCKVCQAVIADKKLFKRIMRSAAFVRGGESLLSLAAKTGIHYKALRNHCENHQAPTEEDLTKAQLDLVSKQHTRTMVRTGIRTLDARQEAIDKLFHKLENGEFDDQMTIRDLRAFLKDADDVKAKQKDQDLGIMRMMQGFRSGELSRTAPTEYIDSEVVSG